ncbi:MAG: hypothetical protein ACJ72E_08755 [Marmoricola sp.]
MRTARTLTTALAAVALVAASGPPASAAPDPTYPTGTFTLSGTGGWMYPVDIGDLAWRTSLVEHDVADDTTPADQVTRVFYSGNGTSEPFTPASLQRNGGALDVEYGTPGTFYPSVHLTDADGHTTVVPLPAVTVLRDEVAPRVHLTLPRARDRNRISAWRVVRGVARDTGGETSPERAWPEVYVLQRRHGYWYNYDFDTRRWHRRTVALDYSMSRSFGERGAPYPDSSGRWHTRTIRGLTGGRLVVHVDVGDGSYNYGTSEQVGYRLVRR